MRSACAHPQQSTIWITALFTNRAVFFTLSTEQELQSLPWFLCHFSSDSLSIYGGMYMMITNKLKLDLQKPGTTPTIHAVQNDSYCRNLEIALFSDHRPFVFPENGTVVIRYKKSDGKGGEYDTLPDGTVAWWAKQNLLTVALAPQVLTTPGSVFLSVTLIASGQQLSVFPIRLAVDPIAAGKPAESENYFYITGLIPAPISGKTGQYLRIATVNDQGRITAVEAVDSVAPQKGLDYWTEADQEAIVQDVLAALGTPVFGTVDAENNIILTGALANGTYTLKYEASDGTVTTIGTLEQKSATQGYTNQIPISTDTDGSIYNGLGYSENTRINSSGAVVTATGYDCSGFIPAEMNDTIYLRNITFAADATQSTQRICIYDENKAYLSWLKFGAYIQPYDTAQDTINNGGIVAFTLGNAVLDTSVGVTATDISSWNSNLPNVKYIRFVAQNIDSDSIITVNEEIME